MHRLFALLCVPLVAPAQERWTQFNSGPFEVFTDAGARAGRETLVRFEQFRNALGQVIGESDPRTPMPVRILLFKNAKEAAARPATEPVITGRDRYAILLASGAPVPPEIFRRCTRLFLESNTARMPASMERGLVDLFSTIEVTGIRTMLGKPVPASERNLDWARVHLLSVNQEYYGKLRVLVYNLRRGVAEDAAYRNAFGKSPAEISKQVEAYFAAGNFSTVQVPNRAMSVEHDFPEKPVEPADQRLAMADLMLDDRSRPAYEAMVRDHEHAAEAWEGLGLLALDRKDGEAARKAFAGAIEANSQSARCYLEYARLESDHAKAISALESAAKLNPKLGEIWFAMAQHDSDPMKRTAHLKTAAERNPREAAYWQALAEAYLDQKLFADAAKAWHSGEQASTTEEQRARMRQGWLSIEQQRLDYEEAERKREAAEKEREIARLKEEARAELRTLEAKANAGRAPAPSEKIVPWWEGPKPTGKFTGIIKQIECLGRQARLVLEGDDHKTLKLLMGDPSQVPVMGGGEQTLACGPQKSRRVRVEYFTKSNARLGTAGEVATIEFQ